MKKIFIFACFICFLNGCSQSDSEYNNRRYVITQDLNPPEEEEESAE